MLHKSWFHEIYFGESEFLGCFHINIMLHINTIYIEMSALY